MILKFTKMHGIGNDYIYFNGFEQKIKNRSELAVKLSDRHFGIGGDGIIIIDKSDTADAKMCMYNADGSEGKMCGNGIRCVGKYIYDNGIVDKSRDIVKIETLSGIKTLKINVKNDKADTLEVDMGKAVTDVKEIPMICDTDTCINKPLCVDGKEYSVTAVSMGNPHCVTFTDDVNNIDIEKIGPKFENHEAFPERVNTEFVRVISPKEIQMRVWERGSGETWACGTGACASVAACVLNGYCDEDTDVLVHLRGGDLVINYNADRVLMTGPAETVFEGEVYIDEN